MKIISVTSHHTYSGILLPDLASVKQALYAYSDGKAGASSNATRAQQPGMTLLGLDMVQSSGNSFIESLFKDIEATLAEQSGFNRSFDYDGVGRFLKTSVSVGKVPEGYVLSFNAAYVGNEAEEGLAEHLGVTRGLVWTKVDIELDAAHGDQFMIDFEPIMDALNDSVFAGLTASEVAAAIAAGYKEEYSSITQRGGFVTLFKDDQFEGTLQLDNITVGSYYEHPYTADESVVTGPLRKPWSGEGDFENPHVAISFDRTGDIGRLILNPAVQQQLLELTDDLKERLAVLVEEVALEVS